MKVWTTTRAFTEGVREWEVEESAINGDRLHFRNEQTDWHNQSFIGEGREWHRTLESAFAQVEKRRAAMISSYRKQIERLSTMKVEVQP